MKPRPPAYANDLKTSIAAGRIPRRVFVIFGRDWGRRPENEPSLCVSPDDFEDLDYLCLAGLAVVIVWRDRAADACHLGALIADYAVDVKVAYVADDGDWPAVPGSRVSEPLDLLMPALPRPAYWPVERSSRYLARKWARLEGMAGVVLGDRQQKRQRPA